MAVTYAAIKYFLWKWTFQWHKYIWAVEFIRLQEEQCWTEEIWQAGEILAYRLMCVKVSLRTFDILLSTLWMCGSPPGFPLLLVYPASSPLIYQDKLVHLSFSLSLSTPSLSLAQQSFKVNGFLWMFTWVNHSPSSEIPLWFTVAQYRIDPCFEDSVYCT